MSSRPLYVALLALALAAIPVAAIAHSELDPAGSSFALIDADGAKVGSGEVDLNIAARNILRGTVSITTPGTYRIAWTSLSLDGDTLRGTVTFGYRLSSPPNTSMLPRRSVDPLPVTAAGILLVGAAVPVAARRISLR